MTTDVLCEVCGEGPVVSLQDSNEIEYKGKRYVVPLRMSQCQACGSAFASAADLRVNKRAVIGKQKELDGLLDGRAIRHIRSFVFRLSQEEAGRVFGGGPVAFSKYESNDVAQSAAMDNLLRAAEKIPAVLELLTKRAGIELTAEGKQFEAQQAKISVQPSAKSSFTGMVVIKKIRQCNYQPVMYRFGPEDIFDVGSGELWNVLSPDSPAPRASGVDHVETHKTLTFSSGGFAKKRPGRFVPKPRHRHCNQ